MDCVQVHDWLIKTSRLYDRIMVCMFSMTTFECIIHWVKDPMEANLLIEYVIEKGKLYD